MSGTIYPYYERELHFIRREAEEFGKQYPAAAGQLLLERNRSRDPHVERLIEAFALLSARVQKKVDDDFPEITDGMLSMISPHYLAPIPSLAIAQINPNPSSPQVSGLSVPRGSGLRSASVEGTRCRYRSCYPVTVWPIEVSGAELLTPPFNRDAAVPAGTAAMLKLRLTAQADLRFEQLSLGSLRFHLSGDQALMAVLYELLLNNATQVSVGDGEEFLDPTTLPGDAAIQPVGFAEHEGLLPYPAETDHAYRLLTELFAFPDKFAFIDIKGLDADTLAGVGRTLEIRIALDRCDEALVREIDASTFRLGCTPIVNLFSKVCEPIRNTKKATEYLVTTDLNDRDAYEIYSVDQVTGVSPRRSTEYTPIFGLNHENSWHGPDEARSYWQVQRRESPRHNDRGTDMYLRLVDLDFTPHQKDGEAITVQATCTNRDLPLRLPTGSKGLRFELESAMPVGAVRCLRHPTAPTRASLGSAAKWRLISHLSLNHLSLSETTRSTEALQEILRLYDFADKQTDPQRAIANSEMIDGIVHVSARRCATRIGGALEGGVCRGVAVELTLDDERYRSVGSYLFASVLERFLAQYCHANSFTKLHFSTTQEGLKRVWPARSGGVDLL
ncbi:type VI secretion system baseplate subunit TssF [Aeoliella sp.]|uniref:type VI secretion system baseplate subunit TssF n=1 Tax=Aeoliella sp. TaxID=2795800 RepID=UPI003CCB8373